MRYSLVTIRIIRFHFLLVSFLDAVHRSSFQFVTLELHNMYSHAKNSSPPTFSSADVLLSTDFRDLQDSPLSPWSP